MFDKLVCIVTYSYDTNVYQLLHDKNSTMRENSTRYRSVSFVNNQTCSVCGLVNKSKKTFYTWKYKDFWCLTSISSTEYAIQEYLEYWVLVINHFIGLVNIIGFLCIVPLATIFAPAGASLASKLNPDKLSQLRPTGSISPMPSRWYF